MSKDYYFIHRNTGKTEPIIVEYGFLDSKGNDVNLLKNNYQQLAEATVQALLEYIGYNSNINENTYTVKSGDSLWSIAKKFNTTLQDLKQLNNLSSNLLNVGQILQIPESSPVQNEYMLYTVKNGDTLYSISRNFNTTPQELRIKNNLGSNFLSIGQQLKVPNNSLNGENDNDFIEYTVKSGDTLYSISRNYNVGIQDLMKINNLSSNLLSVGQILQIPSEQVNTTYVVKNGDTLYSIASQFNTTVDNLKQKNNLTNNIISIGQVLNI
ncbi:MAG: LysM peptidoglycan-binding domain-containing protein [Bacilli bacterium]|nr:LysM peptidoglycan-binding domain-containing protein [Bacilli bacterium]